MPEAWKYTTFVDFMDHWQTLIAGAFALITAIIAVMVTIRIERWKARTEDKEALLTEIRVTNTITMVTVGITNAVLSYKKQHIKPLKLKFDQDREITKQTMVMRQQNGGKGKIACCSSRGTARSPI